MKLSKAQFQAFLDAVPPEVWAVIYTELKDPEAKRAMRAALFDGAGHARHLSDVPVRNELLQLVTQHQEIKSVLVKAANKYHMKRSWKRFLPWNWR